MICTIILENNDKYNSKIDVHTASIMVFKLFTSLVSVFTNVHTLAISSESVVLSIDNQYTKQAKPLAAVRQKQFVVRKCSI